MVSQTLSIQHVGLWSNLVKVFSEEVSPLRLQRKFVRTVWRWMDVYLRDLPPDLVSFAVKCYYGHRGIPTALDQLVDDLKRFNQRADVVKLGKLIKDAEKRGMRRNDGLWSVPVVVDPASDRFVGVGLKKKNLMDLGYMRLYLMN